MNDDVAQLFRDVSVQKLDRMHGFLNACLDRLDDEQIWHREGEHQNSVANLVLHLCGNMRQWVVFAVGKQPDVRVRELEFSTAGGLSVAQVRELFSTTVAEARGVIASVSAERLAERTVPQGDEVSVLDAIYQAVCHVHQHVGQIILLTKELTGKDLDLTRPRPR